MQGIKKWLPVLIMFGAILCVIFYGSNVATFSSKPMPMSGEIERHIQQTDNTIYANFEIKAISSDFNYLFKLEDWDTGVVVSTVFVRKGENVNIPIPLGHYRGKYAYGHFWQGMGEYFGHNTTFKIIDDPLIFYKNDNQIFGNVIDFSAVNGNLKTSQGNFF